MLDAVGKLFLVLGNEKEENGQCRTPLENSSSPGEISDEFGGLNAFMNSPLSRENIKSFATIAIRSISITLYLS